MGKKKTPEWREFEKAVAEFHRSLDPNARVEHDVRLPDKQTGSPRQRDVWIEGKVSGIQVKALVSCKRYQRVVDSGDIDRFYGEFLNSGAHIGLLYSYSGFSRPALEKAKKLDIPTYTLFSGEPNRIPQRIEFYWLLTLPEYTIDAGGDFKKLGVDSWDALLDLSPPGEAESVVESCANELVARARAERTPAGLTIPVNIRTHRMLKPSESEEPCASFGVRCRWKAYISKQEAIRLSGRYSFGEQTFEGTQTSPPIDTLHPPGEGWELVESGQKIPLPVGTVVLAKEAKNICETIRQGAKEFPWPPSGDHPGDVPKAEPCS